MKIVTVWALVFFVGDYKSGGPAIIDDMPTLAECRRVSAFINMETWNDAKRPVCISRQKVMP